MAATSSLRMAFAALFLWVASTAGVQRLRVTTTGEAANAQNSGAQLVFSESGDSLFVIGQRDVTYNARSMAITNMTDIQPGARVFSVSPTGPTALIGIPYSGTRIVVRLLNLRTGQLQDLPSGWYDADYGGGAVSISGDGRLISVYSEDGPADQPMTVTVYDWRTKNLVARWMSSFIAAGGIFGGGVTVDGLVEFENNRVGRKVVDLKTGRSIGMFGFSSIRSPKGKWVVEFPDRTFKESTPKDLVVKDGSTAAVLGKLEVQIEDDEAFAGNVQGAFCGATGRFVLARRNSVTVHSIPSGSLLVSLPATSWHGGDAAADDRVRVACSSNGRRVAVLSGRRLTMHELK